MKKKNIMLHLLCFLAAAGISAPLKADTKYEAESAELSLGLSISQSITGHSGSGYVGNFSNDNDKLTFRISISAAGYYDLFVGFAAPYGDKINNISINGAQMEFTVSSSTSFSEKSIGKVRLSSGENVIEITKNWGWFYVDYLRVAASTDPETFFNLSDQLVTPDASANAQTLFQFLKDHFQKKIISGVMTLNSFDETDWLKQHTGKEPALIGLDFMHCNRNYSWYNDDTPGNDAESWYNKNGIPTLAWHWRDPSRITEAFYTDGTTFDVSKIHDESSAEYQAMLADIDFIALLLKELADKDIPVLWRPLHEASGGWFWWGAKGPEACKGLWQLMFDRLVDHHQINNLIWVWTTDTRTDALDWYPGDEYVDILGVDIYAETADFGSQYLAFDQIKANFEGKKMVTLSECGIVPDPDKLKDDEAGWSWFMPWYGDFVRDGISNPLSHWQKVMDHAYVITLDEMPDLRTYVTSASEFQQKKDSPFYVAIDRIQQTVTIEPVRYRGEYNFEIYSLSGRCVLKQQYVMGTRWISLAEVPAGLVLVSIQTPEARYSHKLIH
jgi:mannan endo-1,4-beta-mannosidase